jgi:hypothetical protein
LAAPVLPALLRVTTAVLALSERAAAGDTEAAAQLEALARLVTPVSAAE